MRERETTALMLESINTDILLARRVDWSIRVKDVFCSYFRSIITWAQPPEIGCPVRGMIVSAVLA